MRVIKKKTDKNRQILDAATLEFLHKGVESASMQRIYETAEVSSRTLYKYYPTKEVLYDTLINEILEYLEESYQFDFSKGSSLEDGIERIIKTKIEFSLNDSLLNITKIMMGEMLKSRYPSDEQMLRLNKSELLFVEWVKLKQAEGIVVKDIDAADIANKFHAVLKADTFWPLLMGRIEKEELDIDRITKSAKAFFIKMYKNK